MYQPLEPRLLYFLLVVWKHQPPLREGKAVLGS